MSRLSHIRLTIGRLTLVGVAPGDAAAVRRALVGALEGQIAGADTSMLAADRAHLRLDMARGEGPAALGRAAGRAVGNHLVTGRR